MAGEVDLPEAFLRQTGALGGLVGQIDNWIAEAGGLFGLGVSGAQGTGKTTFSRWLVGELAKRGRRAVRISIDDLYLTRSERMDMAANLHPLFATRGVPGTHDVRLALRTFDALCRETGLVEFPVFDKAMDDRHPEPRLVTGRPDVLIFEGWCVGCEPGYESDAPINDLEAEEDPDGSWRQHIEDQLDGPYRMLFHEMVDRLVFLAAPDMEAVFEWRWQQERELAARSGGEGARVMNESEVRRFIMHYERLTRRMFTQMPHIAASIIRYDRDHHIQGVELT